MLKDRIVNIGVGQCGGNIVHELEKFDNQVFYINSSLDDLKTLDTNSSKKYCIENAQGMAKDVKYANEVITSNDNDEKITDAIYERYSNQKIYNFHFSLSGGTGGGMTIQIMETFKEFYPDKCVNAVVVYPHNEEGMLMQSNARKCLEKLKNCLERGVVNSLQILNNNSKEINEKFAINKEYAELYEELISFDWIDDRGNLDKEEMERLLMARGVSIIYKLKNEDVVNNLSKLEENTIYAPFHKNPTSLGLILNESQDNAINRDLIEKAFGVPMVTHDIRWKKDYSIIISAGMKFNEDILIHLKESYNKLYTKKMEVENSIIQEVKDIEIDESILNSLTNTQPTNVSNNTPRRRRRGKVGIDAEKRYS